MQNDRHREGPQEAVEELFDISVMVARIVETIEAELDKKTMRLLKTSRAQYSKGQYVVAKGPAKIRKALSS